MGRSSAVTKTADGAGAQLKRAQNNGHIAYLLFAIFVFQVGVIVKDITSTLNGVYLYRELVLNNTQFVSSANG